MASKLYIAKLAVAALLLPAASFGAAIEFANAPVTHDESLSIGFVFTTNDAISVTALGYFDDNQDGFLTNHEVGIFDLNGTLLVSSLLSAGSSGILEGHYRYNAITPITLAGNTSFLIAATTFGSADGFAYGHRNDSLSGFATDPRISVADDASRFVYQCDNVLRAPDEMFGYTIYGGPNFLIAPAEASNVPEPASFALAFAGIAGILIARRRAAKAATINGKRRSDF